MVTRCRWATHDDLRAYHDTEWGVPEHADLRLFELLTLEGAQAGLSWRTILNRRPGYRAAFAGVDPAVVASFGEDDVERLLADPGVIRHRGKLESTVTNARAVLTLREQGDTLDALLWSFVDGVPGRHDWSEGGLPSSTPVSSAMSRELRRRGFRFVGPTTCYSLMQAAGLVDDHEPDCFRSGRASGPAA